MPTGTMENMDGKRAGSDESPSPYLFRLPEPKNRNKTFAVFKDFYNFAA